MKNTRITRSLIFLIVFTVGGVSYGQESLSTDRPDATEGTFVMPQGVMQIEAGWNRSNEDFGEGTLTVCGPGALVRFGVLDNVELRFGIERNRITNNINEDKISGLQPLSIGFKTMLKKEGKSCPEISFLGTLNLSGTGAEDWKLDHHTPSVRFLLSKGIDETFSLGANLGMEWSDDGFAPTTASTLVLGVGLTEWLNSFFELESTYVKDAGDSHIFNFGFTAWLASDTQIDFGYGIGLSDQAVENQMTIGISQRVFN